MRLGSIVAVVFLVWGVTNAGLALTTPRLVDAVLYGTPLKVSKTATGESGAPALSLNDVVARVEAAGYRDISDVEWERGKYEVKARTADGQRVEVLVDGSTGAILGTE